MSSSDDKSNTTTSSKSTTNSICNRLKLLKIRNKNFYSKQILKRSIKRKPFKCKYCDQRFCLKTNLNQHENFHTGKQHKNKDKNNRLRIKFSCKSWEKSLASDDSLIMNQLTPIQRYQDKCKSCEKTVTIKENNSNIKVIISDNSKLKENKEQIARNLSSQRRQSIALLDSEKAFKCQICNHSFFHKCSLTAHERSHEDKEFKCKYCTKTFTEKIQLGIHERLHLEEKPFSCRVCGKAYIFQSTLIVHERSHTDKPYKCAFCSKQFGYKSTLIIHERIHVGERICVKIYKCNECELSFEHLANLERHSISHKEKPYKCECQETFSKKIYLLDHKTKYGEKCCRANQELKANTKSSKETVNYIANTDLKNVCCTSTSMAQEKNPTLKKPNNEHLNLIEKLELKYRKLKSHYSKK